MKSSKSRGVSLGKYIKQLRTSRNISTTAMAAALKIPESNYIQYESGTLSIYVEHLEPISIGINYRIKNILSL
ncbi:helix-turn-helix domain-containing protein [Providencia manganoxydans]|uniref:helix-turn-helix domain-containing protein n=1 Tax=Providencia manganoxydans TaxID=2923283 RepID=UPI0034E43C42